MARDRDARLSSLKFIALRRRKTLNWSLWNGKHENINSELRTHPPITFYVHDYLFDNWIDKTFSFTRNCLGVTAFKWAKNRPQIQTMSTFGATHETRKKLQKFGSITLATKNFVNWSTFYFIFQTMLWSRRLRLGCMVLWFNFEFCVKFCQKFMTQNYCNV